MSQQPSLRGGRNGDRRSKPPTATRGSLRFLASLAMTAMALLAMTANTHAALTLPDVLNKMEAAQKNLNDVQFQFEQTLKQGDLPEVRMSGTAWVLRPNLLKILQRTPARQIVTSNGTTVWLYTPAKAQVIKGSWPAWIKRSGFPLPLMDFVGTFTPEHWRKRYKVFFGGYNNNNKQYELTFKPIGKEAQTVTLWISEETFLPAHGRVQSEGYNVDLVIREMATNTGLKTSAFSPQVPAGTEEIPVTF